MAILEVIGEVVLLHINVLLAVVEAIITWLTPASMRTKSLVGETMLITGAGSGIGRLFACKFAALGVKVVLWDINENGVSETARIVKAQGGKAWWFVCDVTKRENVYNVAQRVREEAGDVTMIVNNAGIVTGKKFLDLRDEEFQRTVEVNSLAHAWVLKAFLPSMMEKNHGHIVTIASIMGEICVVGLTDYCMSKFGAVGFHDCLLREVRAQGKDNIHFTLVNPYKIDTGMFDGVAVRKMCEPMLPTLKPEYLANRVVEAVQTNQSLVRAPVIFHLVLVLKAILPLKALLLLEDFLENEKAMDNFVGRDRGRRAIEQSDNKSK